VKLTGTEYNHHGILNLKKEHMMPVTLTHSARTVNQLKGFLLSPKIVIVKIKDIICLIRFLFKEGISIVYFQKENNSYLKKNEF